MGCLMDIAAYVQIGPHAINGTILRYIYTRWGNKITASDTCMRPPSINVTIVSTSFFTHKQTLHFRVEQ